jgi:hypothetical protein
MGASLEPRSAEGIAVMERTLSASRDLLHLLARRYLRLSSLVALAVIVFTTAAAVLYGSGRLDATTGGYLLLFPLLVLAVAKPAWLVIALVAIPHAFTGSAGVTSLTILLIFALVIHVGRYGSLSLGFTSGLLPLVILLAMCHLFPTDIGNAAAVARDGFLKNLGLNVTLAILSFSLVRTGNLGILQLVPAILIGAGGTAIALLVVGGPSSLIERSSFDVGVGVALQGHFGYLSAMAFIVSLALALLDDDRLRVDRTIRWMIVAFFTATTALSLTRGAWLAALIGLFIVSRRTGKLRYLWGLPVLIALVLLLPVARDRLLGDFTRGGVAESFATGRAGTGRWGLWTRLYDEAKIDPISGHGSGFAFTLDSQTLFGFEGQFVARQSTFVYPHNDFLFWMLEFGLIGVGLYGFFWLEVRAKYKRSIVHVDAQVRNDAVLLIGVFTTMFIATLVSNGLFVPALAERFFVASGALFALTRLHRTGGRV